MVRLVLEHAQWEVAWGPQWKFTLLGQEVGFGVGGEAELFHDYLISEHSSFPILFFFLRS